MTAVRIEVEDDVLRITFENSNGEIGVLSISKTKNGWLHHFAWQNRSDVRILPKPIGEYSKNTKTGGFSFLHKAYSRAIGLRVDPKEFREKVWIPLLNELNSREEYQKFREEAVPVEILTLREMIRKLIIYEKERKDEKRPG